MHHRHRPQKSVLDSPLPTPHLFHFLETELLFLYTFLPTFRSTLGMSRAMMHAVIGSICHTSSLQSLTFAVLSKGNVLSPLLHIHILSFKIHMSPPPPRSPPSFSPWVMDCPFLLLPRIFTCISVEASITLPFVARTLNLPNCILVPLGGDHIFFL